MTFQSAASHGETTLSYSAVVPTTALYPDANDNDTVVVTSNGSQTGTVITVHKFDYETNTRTELPSGTTCPGPMTRAALRALRTAGGLSKDCHYVITNPNAQGTVTAESIILHAVDESTLSMQAGIKTSHDTVARQGVYDIDADDILEMTDNLGNHVTVNTSIVVFPWGNTSVINNEVTSNGRLNYTGGIVSDNVITGNAIVTSSAGTFANNSVSSNARVNNSGRNVQRNEFTSYCNAILSSTGTFYDNKIGGESTITISTTGQVESVTVLGNSNLTMTGDSGLQQTEINEDSQVTLISQSQYNNQFVGRCTYRQVGTGRVRDSYIGNYASVTTGNVNVSRSTITDNSSVNTTGGTGDITTSNLSKATVNAQNVPAFFLRESEMTSLGSINCNNAARVYFYRGNLNSYGRLDVRTGSRVDSSYTQVSGNSYIQSTISGGFLTVNNSNITGNSYVRNTTPNSNTISNCMVGGQSNMRFDGTATGGRIYYSSVFSGTSMYQTTGSVNCYFYYVSGSSVAQIYTQTSTNVRLYYSNATSYSYLRLIGNPTTTNMYYCNADARGYVQMLNNVGVSRMYAVDAAGQAIAELRGSTGNLYYSSFSAYFYAYVTRTTGTTLGAFGQGRRTSTTTNTAPIAPFASGAAWSNI